jgi:hypothetical protein
MNHWRAAQRTGRDDGSTGRWDYTCGNRRTGTYSVGYCSGWQYDKWIERAKSPQPGTLVGDVEGLEQERDQRLPSKDKYHTDGHATADEAIACFRQFKLDTSLDFLKPPATAHPQSLHACEEKSKTCRNYTANLATIAGSSFGSWYLCDEHLNRESVERLFKVGESWGSY